MPAASAKPRRRRPAAWMLAAAAAVLVIGLGASLGGAVVVRANASTHERQTFDSTASDITATFEALLRRNLDLVDSLRAVAALYPHVSPTFFARWFDQLGGRQRLFGSLGTSYLTPVPPSRLASFLADRDRDPAFRSLVSGRVLPITASTATQCLLAAGRAIVPLSTVTATDVQGDWCSRRSSIGAVEAPLLAAATDSGEIVLTNVTAQGVNTVLAEVAVYRPDAPTGTVAQRRAALLGWIAATYDMGAIAHSAIGNHRVAVALAYRNPGAASTTLVHLGTTGDARQMLVFRDTLDIDGPWSIAISGPASDGGLSAADQGAAVFGAGAIVSILIAALVLVLGRSRERALELVAQKTGQLRYQALHDPLTGLPNRALALDRADQMLARSRRTGLPVAALYIDLDGFKHVNDTFGHASGDELLKTVAERLLGATRESDTAARLGGDEFLVLLEGPALEQGPELVAERILAVLREPYDVGERSERSVVVTASIGVVLGQRTGADELLRDADLALYAAKADGRDGYAVFQSSMQVAAEARILIELDLAGALQRRELFLLYQPVFDLASERIIGVEALLRWRHPARGVLAPEEFLAIADASGQIVPIGRWVLDEACRTVAGWHDEGRAIGLSVNISARQLEADGIVEDVHAALAASGLPATSLTLEVTESSLMSDTGAVGARLEALKAIGVRIAIDDFGNGYSSLAHLRQYPVDAIKIDRAFIQGVASSRESAALIHILVRLGKTLHLETLAEGIEERAQLRELQRQQCDSGQGFLFARPLEPGAVDALLELAEPLETTDAKGTGDHEHV